MAVDKKEELFLYAWMGKDELGSGEVGIKQASCPAGLIPMVAISKEKMNQDYITRQLQAQAKAFGNQIELVRFRFDGVERVLLP